MIVIFYILAALLIFLSWKSFRGGIDYLRYFRKELAKPRSAFTPKVSIIAPCRGMDDGMEANFLAILCQDYPWFEVIFVVDDASDPAVVVIQAVARESIVNAARIEIVTAPRAKESGQKVENLREGVLHAADESEAFVFVDSDGRPSPDFLRSLIAPLESSRVGAATGYRWFVTNKSTFSSEMRSVWNASVASALGENSQSNFAWGGGTAIMRKTFEEFKIRENWRGTLSDDFALTRVLKSVKLDIVFVPRALTASVGDCSLRELLEFTTRQIKITRVYAPHLWAMSFFGSGLFNIVMGWALLIAILSPRNNTTVTAAIVVIATVSTFSIGKALLRLRAVHLALPQFDGDLKKQAFTQSFLWLLAPALFFVNCVAALFSRKITWRGVTYYLLSASETLVGIRRNPS